MAKKKKTFHNIVAGAKPTLVDFYATWCGPCKAMMPILKQVKSNMGDDINILKIDVDKNQALAHKLQVRGVPTLAVYQYGKIVWRQSGVKTAKELTKVLSKYVEAEKND